MIQNEERGQPRTRLINPLEAMVRREAFLYEPEWTGAEWVEPLQAAAVPTARINDVAASSAEEVRLLVDGQHFYPALYERIDAAHQATMRRVLLRMVSLEGDELARRRVQRAELVYGDAAENDQVATVMQLLSQARLVVEGKDEEGEPYAEPAHDALVRG